MIKYCFSTVASCDCLYKLVLLYKSLSFHNRDFRLFVLCADEQSYKILKEYNFEKLSLIKLEEVEDEALLKVRQSRSFMEYCWTLKSVVLQLITDIHPDAAYYGHLDSDLCFFSGLDCIFEEAPDSSIFITDHNNSDEFLYTYESSGRYNSGFIGFKNDSTGRAAIQWWKEKCLDWCYVTPDINKRLYGDQRYLEWMYESFQGVHVIKNKGVNTAHWSVKKYKVALRDQSIYVDDDKLVFYHFSGFMIISPKEFSISWLTEIDPTTVDLIYLPYMMLLSEEIKHIQNKYRGFDKGFLKIDPGSCRQYYRLKG